METTKKRKISGDEYPIACEMLYQLTEILLAVGVTELKISKKERDIFWNTEDGGMIDPEVLEQFSTNIDDFYIELLSRSAE